MCADKNEYEEPRGKSSKVTEEVMGAEQPENQEDNDELTGKPHNNDTTDGCANKSPETSEVDSPINLLLVGSSGNGLSSTKRSIMQDESKTKSGGWDTITKENEAENVEGKINIKVIDMPGINFRELRNKKERMLKCMSSVYEAFKECPDGFNAIIIVLSYNRPKVTEDQQSIEIFKEIFGNKFLRDHAILVMTHGDFFKDDEDDNDTVDFKTWCGYQTGYLMELLGDCKHRCVLFDNRTKQTQNQLNELVECLTNVQPYTSNIFSYNENNYQLIDQSAIESIKEGFERAIGSFKAYKDKDMDIKKIRNWLKDEIKKIEENHEKEYFFLKEKLKILVENEASLDKLNEFIEYLGQFTPLTLKQQPLSSRNKFQKLFDTN